MAYNGFAIDEYLDAEAVTRQLDELKKKPIYSVRPEKLKEYEEEYFEKKCPKSKAMISEAKNYIPGGVQHNLAFNHPFPIVITKAEGNKLYDLDGNRYYDLLQAGGPTILGSNDPVVKEAVIDLLNTCGPSTGLFHEYEYKLAKKISDCVPSVDKFRMLGSGTEACMCALRVARLKTGKKNVLKMGGAYHGWSDQLAYGMRIPGTKGLQSPGVPNFVFKHTDEFFPNDLEDLERKLKKNQLIGGTAAVYIEPIGPESGTRPVSKEFVRGCQELAHKYGALLVCDEVVSGFRIGLSGAQGFYGIDPDLTIFGKRDNVLLIREGVDGKKEVHRLNLNDANLINSPYYYVQQNDYIYVEPNKVEANNAYVGATTSLWMSFLSVGLSLTGLLIGILK